jgi:hypothetical protein
MVFLLHPLATATLPFALWLSDPCPWCYRGVLVPAVPPRCYRPLFHFKRARIDSPARGYDWQEALSRCVEAGININMMNKRSPVEVFWHLRSIRLSLQKIRSQSRLRRNPAEGSRSKNCPFQLRILHCASCFFAAVTMFSALKPNFFNSCLRGADAPNVSMQTL